MRKHPRNLTQIHARTIHRSDPRRTPPPSEPSAECSARTRASRRHAPAGVSRRHAPADACNPVHNPQTTPPPSEPFAELSALTRRATRQVRSLHEERIGPTPKRAQCFPGHFNKITPPNSGPSLNTPARARCPAQAQSSVRTRAQSVRTPAGAAACTGRVGRALGPAPADAVVSARRSVGCRAHSCGVRLSSRGPPLACAKSARKQRVERKPQAALHCTAHTAA